MRSCRFRSAYFFASVVAVVLGLGCNRPVNSPVSSQPVKTADPTGIYPHTTAFRTGRAHGEHFKKSGETCKACHGAGLQGGTANVSCTQCHKNYPHSDSFKTTASHGTLALVELGTCVKCHSAEPDDPQAPAPHAPSCVKCHAYPHPTNWFSPQVHGTKYLKTKDMKKPKGPLCLDCHGEKSSFKQRHPGQFVSCGSCHSLIPHPSEMEGGPDHSKALIKAMQSSPHSCTVCHTDFRRLPDSKEGNGCYACHSEKFKIGVEITVPEKPSEPAKTNGTIIRSAPSARNKGPRLKRAVASEIKASEVKPESKQAEQKKAEPKNEVTPGLSD